MLVFLACFLECALLFLDDHMDEEYKWFSNSKKYPQGVA